MRDPPAACPHWAYFLDIDGTLVAIARTPGEVVVEPGLIELLGRLQEACDGAVALISGRRLADIDALFRPLRLPAAGLHGLERRRADGTGAPPPVPAAAIAALRPLLAAFAEREQGVLLEDKEASLALHYRLRPDQETAIRSLARRLAGEAGEELRLIEGKMVVELQPRGADKGRSVAAFMDEPPFAGRLPVFAGDDSTDEDGFAMVNRLSGLSLRVGEDRRPSAARCQLPSVAALRRWLEGVTEQRPAATR